MFGNATLQTRSSLLNLCLTSHCLKPGPHLQRLRGTMSKPSLVWDVSLGSWVSSVTQVSPCLLMLSYLTSFFGNITHTHTPIEHHWLQHAKHAAGVSISITRCSNMWNDSQINVPMQMHVTNRKWTLLIDCWPRTHTIIIDPVSHNRAGQSY